MSEWLVSPIETFEWQKSVKDRLATPPGSPARGDRYLVIATASGAWVGKENQIAYCSDVSGPVWMFIPPLEGMSAWVQDENVIYLYDGSVWKIADQTLDQVCDLGSVTDQTITAASLKANGNIYVNFDGPDDDSFLYFYNGGSNTGSFLKWDDVDARHELSHALQVAGDILAGGNLTINQSYGSESKVTFCTTVTTIFRQGVSPTTSYAGCTDTYLKLAAPTTNHDADGYLKIRNFSADSKSNTLIRFDVSSIPSAATVISATLTLVLKESFGAPFNVSTYALKRNWVETQATWNIYSTGNAWEIPGGTGTGDVYAKESTVVVTNTDAVFSIPIMVQDWVDGSLANYGVNLIPDAYTSKYWYGWDSDYTPGGEPYLTITYSIPYEKALRWDQSNNRFEFSNNLLVSGELQASQVVKQLWGTVVRVVAKNLKGDYSTVQAAVDAAASGDTILIMPGTYDESIVLKDGVNLVGIDRTNCILKYTGLDYTVICGGSAITSAMHNLTIDHDNYLKAAINISGTYIPTVTRGVLELYGCTILNTIGFAACFVEGGTLKLRDCIISPATGFGIISTHGPGSVAGSVYAEHSTITGHEEGFHQDDSKGLSEIIWCDISGTIFPGIYFNGDGNATFDSCQITGGSNDAAATVSNGTTEAECRFINCHLISNNTNLIDLESGSATIGMYNCVINKDTKPAGLTVVSGAEATNYGRSNISRASGATRTGTIHLPVAGAIIGDGTAGSAGAGLSIYTTTDVTDPQVRHFVLAFDPDTDEHAFWQFRMPDDYLSGGTLKLIFYMGTAQVDNTKYVDFNAVVQAITPDSDTTNMSTLDIATDGGGWAVAVKLLNYANPATANRLLSLSIDLSSKMDSAAAGDFCIIGLRRDADEEMLEMDTAIGDAIVVAVDFTYTRA